MTGEHGSGTVFFSRCTLRCGYCQNYPWSQEGKGDLYDEVGLEGILDDLTEAGCHNWNLVSPTPWLPRVAPLVASRKAAGRGLPVVCNSSGFERVEVLAELEGIVDVYLMDLRYASARTAEALSGAADYVAVARRAIAEVWRQKGPVRCDGEGLAVRGVICRILVLPGHADEAAESLRWLAETCGTDISVSLMSQYRPVYGAAAGTYGPEWRRGVTQEEYDTVLTALEDCGFSEGWVQDWSDTPPDSLLGCDMTPGLGTAGTPGGSDVRGD